MGIPAFTNVASWRVKTATPFALVTLPNWRRFFFAGAAPLLKAVEGRGGALAAKVAGTGAAGAERTESFAMGLGVFNDFLD